MKKEIQRKKICTYKNMQLRKKSNEKRCNCFYVQTNLEPPQLLCSEIICESVGALK